MITNMLCPRGPSTHSNLFLEQDIAYYPRSGVYAPQEGLTLVCINCGYVRDVKDANIRGVNIPNLTKENMSILQLEEAILGLIYNNECRDTISIATRLGKDANYVTSVLDNMEKGEKEEALVQVARYKVDTTLYRLTKKGKSICDMMKEKVINPNLKSIKHV
jgi:hypothetical protein